MDGKNYQLVIMCLIIWNNRCLASIMTAIMICKIWISLKIVPFISLTPKPRDGSSRRSHLVNDSAFTLSDGTFNASVVVRNLGAYLYQSLLLKDHVSRLVRSCFYQLCRIKSVRRLLPTSVAIQLVNSFVISRVNYCNSILAGSPVNLTNKIQSVLNAAARLLYERGASTTSPTFCVTNYIGFGFHNGSRSNVLY